MSREGGPVSNERENAVAEAQRRRRIAAVFGDPLPEGTSDERDDGETGDRGSEAWLRSQVPPHHG